MPAMLRIAMQVWLGVLRGRNPHVGVSVCVREGETLPNVCHGVRAKVGRESLEPIMFAGDEAKSKPLGEDS